MQVKKLAAAPVAAKSEKKPAAKAPAKAAAPAPAPKKAPAPVAKAPAAKAAPAPAAKKAPAAKAAPPASTKKPAPKKSAPARPKARLNPPVKKTPERKRRVLNPPVVASTPAAPPAPVAPVLAVLYVLEIDTVGLEPRTVEVNQELVIVGTRENAVQIKIEDSTVSGLHCKLLWTAQGVVVSDIRAKNGTMINRQMITAPTLVPDGAKITVGVQTEMTVRYKAAISAPPPAHLPSVITSIPALPAAPPQPPPAPAPAPQAPPMAPPPVSMPSSLPHQGPPASPPPPRATRRLDEPTMPTRTPRVDHGATAIVPPSAPAKRSQVVPILVLLSVVVAIALAVAVLLNRNSGDTASSPKPTISASTKQQPKGCEAVADSDNDDGWDCSKASADELDSAKNNGDGTVNLCELWSQGKCTFNGK